MNDSLLTYQEALHIFEERIVPFAPVRIAWRDTLGSVLAEKIRATGNLPPFDNSAMDGYAVLASDTETASIDKPVILQIVETIHASPSLPQRQIESGQAARIMTGAPIPEGADAVVMIEHTETDGNRARIFAPARAGQYIRAEGSELKKGARLLDPGTPIGGAERSIIAMQGCRDVLVRTFPKTAVFVTGDELVDPDETPHGGQIRNVNTYSLAAELEQLGCTALDLGIVLDEPEKIRSAIERGLSHADVLIASGGVSMGDKDYLPGILRGMGMEVFFHKLKVKPGKPILAGRLNDRYVFGLPGNVVSALTSFHLFVKPALRLMAGYYEWRNRISYVRFGQLMHGVGRTHFVRCRLSHSPGGLPIAFPTGQQDSGMLSSMLGADGFAVIPSDIETVNEFDVLEFISL